MVNLLIMDDENEIKVTMFDRECAMYIGIHALNLRRITFEVRYMLNFININSWVDPFYLFLNWHFIYGHTQDINGKLIVRKYFDKLLGKKFAFKVYVKSDDYSIKKFFIVQRMTDDNQTIEKLMKLYEVRLIQFTIIIKAQTLWILMFGFVSIYVICSILPMEMMTAY